MNSLNRETNFFMKISKILLLPMVVIAIVLILPVYTNSYTNEELVTYITDVHHIGGNEYKLTNENAENIKEYLIENPVTDEQAEQIKSLIEQAKQKVNNKEDLANLTDGEKTEIVSLLQQSGNIAGLNVSVNTSNNVITVNDEKEVLLNGSYMKSGNGGIVVEANSKNNSKNVKTKSYELAYNGGSKSFVYTGSNYNLIFISFFIFIVVTVSTIVVVKKYVK